MANFVSPENSNPSFSLGPNAFFEGGWVEVVDYTTVTVSAAGLVPPATADAISILWNNVPSDTDLLSISVFGSDASTFQTVHATVRAQWMRVRYRAGAAGTTGAKIQTLLRDGPIAGAVSRIGLITGSPDAQDVNGVLMGKSIATGSFLSLLATADPYLIVSPPPNRGAGPLIITPANINPVLLDPNVSPSTRRWATIHNNTTRGNLYIRLGASSPTVSNYDFKIPPQHSWQMPSNWVETDSRVRGVWDVADGFCHYQEAT